MKQTLIAILFCSSFQVFGQETTTASSPFSPGLEGPKSAYWGPLGSLILPGFDQFRESQYGYGGLYTGLALTGISINLVAKDNNQFRTKDGKNSRDDDWKGFGRQLTMASGGYSAYHSFRTAVRTRPSDYSFMDISKEDTPKDLFQAPFKMQFLTKPTTFIPLGTFAAVLSGLYFLDRDRHFRSGGVLSKTTFVTGTSYLAGTWEEAAFRGWLLPAWQQSMNNSYAWANLAQGTLFGAVHYSSQNKFPVFQTLFGLYAGYLTKENGYSIQESTFIHFWWDVLALGFGVLTYTNAKDKKAAGANLMLPMLTYSW